MSSLLTLARPAGVLSRGKGTEVVLRSLLLGTPQTSSLCSATYFAADSQEGTTGCDVTSGVK